MANVTLRIRVPSPTRILIQLAVDGQVNDCHVVELAKASDLDDGVVQKAVQNAAKTFSVSTYSTPVERDETVASAVAKAAEERRVKEEAKAKAEASADRRLKIAAGTIVNEMARVCEEHGVRLVKTFDGLELRYTDATGREFKEYFRRI